MRMITKISIASLLCLVIGAGDASALASSPTQTLRNTNQKISRLLKQRAPKGTARAKRLEDKLKQEVNRFLDFRELARLSLAKHWEQRSEAEQQEFVSILRQLIEKSYIKQLRTQLAYKVDYRKQSVDGTTARVFTVIKTERDGRPEEITVEYKMRRVGAGWMVYDVITDDVSIVRNYRSQFNRIIRKNSYKKLVAKMRRKLEKI